MSWAPERSPGLIYGSITVHTDNILAMRDLAKWRIVRIRAYAGTTPTTLPHNFFSGSLTNP